MSATTATDLAAFREARRHYIGGTDAAAIAGISSWASPLSVYMDKVMPEQVEDKDSLPMRRGLWNERFVADEFCRANPQFVVYHPKPIVRTDWGFPAGASVDFMVAEVTKPRTPVAGLETKMALSYYSRRQWDEERGELPDAYFVQVQWYLAVTELPLFYSAADVGDDRLRVVKIAADQAVQRNLIERCASFWRSHIEAQVPPEPIGTDADARALRHMYPDTIPDPPLVFDEADLGSAAILKTYLTEKAVADEHATKAEEAKQRLQKLMGENETAILGGYRLAWKTQTRTTIDTKRLKAEKPDIAAEYSHTSDSRVFTQPKEIPA